MGLQISQLARLFSGTTTPDSCYFHIQVLGDDNKYRDYKVKGSTMKALFLPYRAELNKIEVNAGTIIAQDTLDLGALTGDFVFINAPDEDHPGNPVITSFGVTAAGTMRTIYFDTGLTITHDPDHIVLPTAADYETASAGDVATFRSLGAGKWLCISWMRADGSPLQQCFEVKNLFSELETASDASIVSAHGYLKLRIGNDVEEGDVQAYSPELSQLALIHYSVNTKTLFSAANYAVWRTLLGLVIGADVMAYAPTATRNEMLTGAETALRAFSPRLVANVLPRLAITGLPTVIANKFYFGETFSMYCADSGKYHELYLSGNVGEEVIEFGAGADADLADARFAVRYHSGGWRVDDFGNFQLWNITQNKFQTVTVGGLPGEEDLVFDVPTTDQQPKIGLMLVEVAGSFRFLYDGTFQLYDRDTFAMYNFSLSGVEGEVTYQLSAAQPLIP